MILAKDLTWLKLNFRCCAGNGGGVDIGEGAFFGELVWGGHFGIGEEEAIGFL